MNNKALRGLRRLFLPWLSPDSGTDTRTPPGSEPPAGGDDGTALHGSRDALAAAQLGLSWLKKGDAGKALSFLRKAQEEGMEGHDIHQWLAEACRAAGDAKVAVAEYEKALGYRADDYAIVFELLELYKADKAYDRALGLIEKCPAIEKHPQLHHYRGALYCDQGNYDGAIVEFKKALCAEPGNRDVVLMLCRVYKQAGHFGEAEALLEETLQAGGDDARVIKELADIYAVQKKFARAAEQFELALKSDPADLWAVTKLGEAYSALGDDEHARRLLAQAIERGADAESIHKNLGEIYRRRGEPAAAAAEFERILALDPRDTGTVVQLADLCIGQGDAARALAVLERAAAHGATGGVIQRKIGEILRAQKRYPEAAAAFARAWEIDRSDVAAGLMLGEMYLQTGDRARGEEILEAIRAANGGNAEVHRQLGQLCYEAGKDDAAAEQLEQALVLKPEDAYAAYMLGTIYARRKDYERARQQYCTALQNGLSDYRTHCEIGKLYARENQYAQAVQEFDAAIRAKIEEQQRTGSAAAAAPRARFPAGQESLYAVRKPTCVFVYLTSRCNLRCVMCNTVRDAHPPLPREAFDKLRPVLPHLNKMHWQGGEVFMVDYFKDLISGMHRDYPNIRHSIITNGLLVNEEWAHLLAEVDVNLIFSIDALSRELYEGIRVGGQYERLLKNLDLLNEAYGNNPARRAVFSVNVVVMRRNLAELPRFPEFCTRYGIRELCFSYMEDSQLVAGEVVPLKGTEARAFVDRVRTTVEDVRAECRARGIEFQCDFEALLYAGRDTPEQRSVASRAGAAGHREAPHCLRPWTSLFIDPTGMIKPAYECPFPVGNILKGTVDEAWNGDVMRMYRRRLLEGNCAAWCAERCRGARLNPGGEFPFELQ
jgi:tetratricopeptide (TPR) repeat protein